MKRLLLAAVIALVIHGLLLAVKPPWFLNQLSPEASRPLSIRLQMQATPAPVHPDPNDTHPEEPEPEKQPEPTPEPPSEPVIEPAPEPIADPVPEPEPDPVPESKPVPEPAPAKVKRVVEAPEPTEKPKPQPAAPENIEISSSDHLPDESAFVSGPVESIPLIQAPPAPRILEAKPSYLENKPPEYPRIARRRGHSGTVMLEVLVSVEGHPEEVRVFSSSGHRILDESALAAVAEWSFEPGTVNGSPVSMWVRVPVRFDLK